MQITRIVILLAVINLSVSILKITSPIINELVNNEIEYSLANFGEIHYGTTLKGILEVSKESPNLCNNITHLNNSNTILIAQRGECSFVKKVINGQKAGAKMVIISDNVIENSAYITMADDGNGRQVHIPSIFISEVNGEILEAQLHRTQIELSIRFDIKQTDKVNMTLYLNINDRHSAILVRELKQSFKQLKSYINLDLAYYSQSCSDCTYQDCYYTYNNNDYCIFTKNKVGSSLINIELQQYGIFLNDNQKWFQLYDKFDLYCSGSDLDVCFVQQKVQVNATQIDGYQTQHKPSILQNWRQDALVSGIYSYPAAKINGVKYLGNIDSDDILQMVCASLKSPPQIGCGVYDYLDIVTNNKGSSNTALILWIILTIIVTVALIFLAVFIYKKTVKKQITNQMSLKVTQLVSQYIKLSSETEKKSRNKQIQNSREDL